MVPERVNDAHWSLAMSLAWITYRTEQAVSDIKQGTWQPTGVAISDLLSALRSGKLLAHGLFEGEQIPHSIEVAVWSPFEIVVQHTVSGAPLVIARSTIAPHTQLLGVTVPAAKVRKLWPTARPTVVAATRCRNYLVAEMRRLPDRAPKPKAEFFRDCQARFAVSERGFERAWAYAITETGAVGWKQPGRRRKLSH
jgi:uncharacterized short protein YbdD (DUF466 family)